MELQELKKEWMKNVKFAEAYNNPSLQVQIGNMITEIRLKFGLTQEKLAYKISTTKTVIARVENGKVLPRIEFLQKIAMALKIELKPPRFVLK